MSGSEGTPKLPEPSGVDLARVALRAAKEAARARGDAVQQKKQVRRGGGLRSGARADGRDPMALGSAINRLITERGWETPAAVGGVMGRWPQIVGEDLARKCVPERYDEDERVLHVRCDSTAWATNLRLLAPQLVARLNEEDRWARAITRYPNRSDAEVHQHLAEFHDRIGAVDVEHARQQVLERTDDPE